MDTWGFSWGCSFQTNTSETHFCFRCLSSLAINLPHTPVMALNDLLNRDPVLTSTLQRANISYWSGEQVEQIQKSLLLRSSVTVVSWGQLVQSCGDAITAWMFEGHCIPPPAPFFLKKSFITLLCAYSVTMAAMLTWNGFLLASMLTAKVTKSQVQQISMCTAINISVNAGFHWGCWNQDAPCSFFYSTCVSWVTVSNVSLRLFQGPVQL